MTPYTLHQGDCRDVMAGMDADNVSAIVCDPPYGLGFMGKGWDHGVPGVEFWQAAKRVAKPGAHLLAFGGTRTFHRLTAAIEDAGWEIRDCIFWCFGSGFPKSLNISKDTRFCQCSAVPYNSENSPETRTQVRDLRDGVSPSTLVGEEEPRAILQSTLLRHSSRTSMGKAGLNGSGALDGRKPTELQNEDYRPIEPGVERRSDLLQDAWELPGGAVRQSARMGEANGEGGRLRDGASADHGRVVRIPTDANGSGEPPRSQSGEQHEDEPRTVADECGPQAGRGWPVCSRCGKQDLTGVGTALKPAFEPIIVARKPLAGTVAANVLRYGTGGINVDACRIVTEEPLNGGAYSGDLRQRANYSSSDAVADASLSRLNRGVGEFTQPLGRWPANLIHDGSDEVTALFPESEDGVAGRRSDGVGMFNMGGHAEWGGYGQSGSAARFFYTAKASREDREEGLESLPLRSAGEATDRVDGSAGLNSPRAGASRTNGAHNHHPTVKPTSLMRYLCRLVTPREGVVLDPFMGSGSTGKAAILEGFRFIGIDLEPEYVEIARARCEWAMAQPRQLVLEDAS